MMELCSCGIQSLKTKIDYHNLKRYSYDEIRTKRYIQNPCEG
jgi:hypothetical protein